MNRFQAAAQVRYLLRNCVWTDAGLLFAAPSVVVTNGIDSKMVGDLRYPVAFVRPGAATADPTMAGERPDLVQIEFSVTLGAMNAGDQFGEVPLLGANRVSGSTGRGLLEIEEVMYAALFQNGPASGLPIIFRGASYTIPRLVDGLGYLVFGDYTFSFKGTLARTYEKPSGFARTGSGATAVLSWNATPRWDFYGFVLRRASGATPPATIADGTGVTLSSITATSKTDSPGAGTWSYSLFSQYDDADAGAVTATSVPQTLSGLVVS